MTKLKRSKDIIQGKRKRSNDIIHGKRFETLQCPHGVSNLSLDLLIEILSRLPGSSLSRFRFVSKQWRTLIDTDPILRKLHLDLGFKFGSPSILVHSYKPKVRNHLILIDEAGLQKPRTLKIDPRYNCISSSCNGLICIYNSTNVALFNPTTQQKVVLPKPTKPDMVSHSCFLGYTPTTKEYKVLRFFYKIDYPYSRCEVLTVGSSSWRQITNTVDLLCHCSVAINGVIYMKIQLLVSCILQFDLDVEKFETIRCPFLVRDVPPTIFEMEGKVCVPNLCGVSIELWILESVKSHSWICKYKLMDPMFKFDCFQPVFVRGKILLKSGDELYYYDLNTRLRFSGIHDDGRSLKFGAQVHMESLINLQFL